MSSKYNPNYEGEFNKVAKQSFESVADNDEAEPIDDDDDSDSEE